MLRTALAAALPAVIAFLITGASAQATTGTVFRDLDPNTPNLSAYTWQERPVLIFAPSFDDPRYKQALAALRLAEPGLDDRDVRVLTDTTPGANGLLRQEFGATGFMMILVGKDGGIKLQSDEVISPDQLFATIDRMPMRQREIQQN